MAYPLRRPVRHQHVNMVACHFPTEDVEFVLARHPAYNVAHTNRDVPSEHRLPIFRNPDDVDFQVALRVRSQPIVPHAPKLHGPWLRLKTRGFHHPRRGLTKKYSSIRRSSRVLKIVAYLEKS